MHRVRVRNRASVGATVARRVYSPAPYLCMRIGATRLFGAEIVLGNRYRRVSPHPGLPLFTSARFSVASGFLTVWRRSMMDSVFFQTSLFSRALQGDGWLATVSDAPLPLHFIGGASVAHSSAPCCGCRCGYEPMARPRASSQGGHCPLGSFVCWLATSVARTVSVSHTMSSSGVSVTRSRESWYPLVGRSRSGARLCSDGWGPASARLKARLVNLLTNSSMVSTPRSLAMTSFLTYHPAPRNQAERYVLLGLETLALQSRAKGIPSRCSVGQAGAYVALVNCYFCIYGQSGGEYRPQFGGAADDVVVESFAMSGRYARPDIALVCSTRPPDLSGAVDRACFFGYRLIGGRLTDIDAILHLSSHLSSTRWILFAARSALRDDAKYALSSAYSASITSSSQSSMTMQRGYVVSVYRIQFGERQLPCGTPALIGRGIVRRRQRRRNYDVVEIPFGSEVVQYPYELQCGGMSFAKPVLFLARGQEEAQFGEQGPSKVFATCDSRVIGRMFSGLRGSFPVWVSL
ncbi:hypothetical protein EVAR_23743_1 [Eumeta japonica]|uniref:Uncharacterized protein n=1 Tax=Eumeta variegata TaxID=151549 RepID=A0A4C1VIH4_EUMVA|nr:hypothetical protein EVAR_23743_1 [Eumeta japonica]